MNQEAISKANNLYDEGSVSELYEFIKPYLANDDPYALYFFSRFSLVDWNETDDEYDKRYVDSLTKAAEGNVAEAMYRLSSLYFVGDIVEKNLEIGKRYLDKAMALGFGPAILSVAVSLYYGSNGYPKNRERAIEKITAAAMENISGASEILEEFTKS